MLDSSRDCPGRWRFRLPAPSSNRLWRFGKARSPTCWRHSKLWFIEPGATGLRAAANTLPRWKGPEHDNKYPATDPDSAFRDLVSVVREAVSVQNSTVRAFRKAVSAGFLKPRLGFSTPRRHFFKPRPDFPTRSDHFSTPRRRGLSSTNNS